MKSTIVSKYDYDKKLIITFSWSFIIISLYGVWWAFEPAVISYTKSIQLQSKVALYFLFNGGVDAIFNIVWIIGIIILWLPFLFGPGKEDNGRH